MKNTVGDVVAKIKQEGIIPEPRWKYRVRIAGIWAVLVLVVTLGGLSLSVAYSVLSGLDWDLYRFFHQDIVTYSLAIFPYFWVVLVAIFLTIAFADFRRMETGYRFSRLKITVAAMGGIGVLGAALTVFGIGDAFGDALVKNIPYYGQHMVVTKKSQWMRPEQGLLSGTVDAVSDNSFGLRDFSGKRWNIIVDKETVVKPSVAISSEEEVKIIGTETGRSDDFRAIEIRPWNGRGMLNGSYDRQNPSAVSGISVRGAGFGNGK